MDWISVKDKIPSQIGKYVLTIDKYGTQVVAVYDCGEKCWHSADDVTHWMPLPKPPEEE